ncbi:hypothetical protein [Peribacillus sp. SCS-155]|uniref:hypothetical protein n=1 Tax=Peribacillus sedimenti TaxID=3115297 RepID=UPI003905D65A
MQFLVSYHTVSGTVFQRIIEAENVKQARTESFPREPITYSNYENHHIFIDRKYLVAVEVEELIVEDEPE